MNLSHGVSMITFFNIYIITFKGALGTLKSVYTKKMQF